VRPLKGTLILTFSLREKEFVVSGAQKCLVVVAADFLSLRERVG
jgi:hypothetical protein